MTAIQLLTQAAQAQKNGCIEDASNFCELALAQDPQLIPAKFLLAILCAKSSPDRAAGLLNEVLALEPRSVEALASLANICLDKSRVLEAIVHAEKAVALQPNNPQLLNLLGRCYLSARDLEKAENAFKGALSLQPNFAASHHNFGKLFQLQGLDGEAAKAFEQAARLSPTPSNLLALGQISLGLFDLAKAEACACRCLAMDPGSVGGHLLLSAVLMERLEPDEAEEHLQKAIELDPERREALQIAARQRMLGQIAEANCTLRKALERDPRLVAAYDELIRNTKLSEEDRPLVDGMRKLAAQPLSPTERASLQYALGKACEDLGEYEESMQHYDEANRVTRQFKMGDAPFDQSAYSAYVDLLIEKLSAGESPKPDKPSPDLPILVVGMMRSGTTLAEQILSSHPEVAAGGEQHFWSMNWRRALDNPDVIARLGEEYRSYLQSLHPQAPHVTDKMPGNYHFLGLIAQALPNARIIHMRRNPVDTCLSIWSTPNHVPHEGGHNKADIVFVYRQYLRLIEHWRKILPAAQLLEVDYENLVSEPETNTRKMLEFCGLKWNALCLAPEKNQRLVSTPSLWQVRQPVYKTSIARWRKFEPWLGEFSALSVDN